MNLRSRNARAVLSLCGRSYHGPIAVITVKPRMTNRASVAEYSSAVGSATSAFHSLRKTALHRHPPLKSRCRETNDSTQKTPLGVASSTPRGFSGSSGFIDPAQQQGPASCLTSPARRCGWALHRRRNYAGDRQCRRNLAGDVVERGAGLRADRLNRGQAHDHDQGQHHRILNGGRSIFAKRGNVAPSELATSWYSSIPAGLHSRKPAGTTNQIGIPRMTRRLLMNRRRPAIHPRDPCLVKPKPLLLRLPK